MRPCAELRGRRTPLAVARRQVRRLALRAVADGRDVGRDAGAGRPGPHQRAAPLILGGEVSETVLRPRRGLYEPTPERLETGRRRELVLRERNVLRPALIAP